MSEQCTKIETALQIRIGANLLMGRACQETLEFEMLLGCGELEAKSEMRAQAWV